jgi:uncharacterized membrane protein
MNLVPETDPHSWLGASHFIMLALIGGFGLAHSGLASLRLKAEQWMGPRLYRVLFALVSIALAVGLIVYFLNHRYDGVQLWQLQNQRGIVPVSFVFLYPATFNLLEVAAIQKPQVHLFDAGIIRVTRHPQMVGQVIWCIAHTLWLGTTFALATSFGLVGYHLFAVWHGDRRLKLRHAEAFEAVKAQTSVIPFLAIAQGRQTLVLTEFIRPAYLGIMGFVLLFWWAHPLMVRAATSIRC